MDTSGSVDTDRGHLLDQRRDSDFLMATATIRGRQLHLWNIANPPHCLAMSPPSYSLIHQLRPKTTVSRKLFGTANVHPRAAGRVRTASHADKQQFK